MKAEEEIMYYRVRQSDHPKRSVRNTWYGRTWQAEWEMCPWCPRAYTRWGIERKARRWHAQNLERQIIRAHHRQWWRAHVTQRRDEFYKGIRPVLRYRFNPAGGGDRR